MTRFALPSTATARATAQALAAALACGFGGCGNDIDKGFGVALTVRADKSIDDLLLATVIRFDYLVSGDENELEHSDFTTARPAHRVERLVYRPRKASRSIHIQVNAVAGGEAIVAYGVSPVIALSAGHTSTAEVLLLAGTPPPEDLGTPDDFAVADVDAGVDDLSVIDDLANADAGPQPDLFMPPSMFALARVTTLPLGTLPTGLVTGKLNNDDRPDVVIGFGANVARTLLNDTNGGFPGPLGATTVLMSAGGVVADFTSDGKADLLSLYSGSTNFYLSKGNGDGTFQASPTFTSINSMSVPSGYAIAAANFDNATGLDVAIASTSGLAVLLNDGSGNFTVEMLYTNYTFNSSSARIVVGNFNADALPDIAVLYSSNVYLYLNTGLQPFSDAAVPAPQMFSGPVLYATNTGTPYAFATGDFNTDGKDDLVVVGSTASTVLMNMGNGTFMTPKPLGTCTNCPDVAVADFDRDGRLDVAAADSGINAVRLFHGEGAGVFTPSTRLPVALPNALEALDLNNDLRPDLVVTSAAGTGSLVTLLNDSPGPFANAAVAYPLASVSFPVVGLVLGDFDGDGKPDVAASDANGVNVYLNKAGVLDPVLLTALSGAQGIAVADFNGDTRLDIAVARSDGVYVLKNTGMSKPVDAGGIVTLFTPIGPVTVGTTPVAVGVGDFNKDGWPDVVVVNQGSNNVSILTNDKAGGLGGAVSYGVGMAPVSVVVGRFNADNRDDIAVANSTSNDVSVLIDSGAGIFAVAAPYGAGTTPRWLATGLINADDKVDIIFGAATGVGVLLNSGTGTFPALSTPVVSTSVAGVTVADFNLQTGQDVGYADNTNLRAGVLLNTGSALGAVMPYPIGLGMTAVASGDLNGDLLPELIVGATGSVLVLRNTSK